MKMRGKTNFADRTLRFVKRSLFLVLALSVAIFSLLALFLANQSASTIRAVSKMYMSGLNEQISAHFETAISLRLDQLEVLARDVPSPGIHTDEEERAELIESAQAREFSHLGFLQADGSFDMLYGSQLEVIDLEPYLESLSEGEQYRFCVSELSASTAHVGAG